MFQKHGLPLVIDAELASAPDRLQTSLPSSMFLVIAGYVAASKSAILTHTWPTSLRDAHFPHCFVFVDRYRPPVRNVLSCVSARLANVRRNNGVSCRARAYWMTHFNDDDEDENDNEDDDVTLFMVLRNENEFTRE